jgi:hypothetical protein
MPLNTFDSNSGTSIALQITVLREEQSLKAEFPMLVTLLGMVIEVREEQSLKA